MATYKYILFVLLAFFSLSVHSEILDLQCKVHIVRNGHGLGENKDITNDGNSEDVNLTLTIRDSANISLRYSGNFWTDRIFGQYDSSQNDGLFEISSKAKFNGIELLMEPNKRGGRYSNSFRSHFFLDRLSGSITETVSYYEYMPKSDPKEQSEWTLNAYLLFGQCRQKGFKF